MLLLYGHTTKECLTIKSTTLFKLKAENALRTYEKFHFTKGATGIVTNSFADVAVLKMSAVK